MCRLVHRVNPLPVALGLDISLLLLSLIWYFSFSSLASASQPPRATAPSPPVSQAGRKLTGQTLRRYVSLFHFPTLALLATATNLDGILQPPSSDLGPSVLSTAGERELDAAG